MNWHWNGEHEKAFLEAKRCLVSSEVLVHYDTKMPIKIACDASPFGLGAVLSHVYPDKTERPIAFTSRSLTKAEQNYSQLDREALGLVFGVKKFHQFIYGRTFILETDHKPLVFIFGSKSGLPQMAASRVQRWAVFLSGYQFEIRHVKGTDNCRADSLSRIPLPITDENEKGKEYSYLNYVKDEIQSIDVNIISEETEKDIILCKVRNFILNGWPEMVHDEMRAFKSRERELSVEQGCVLWGHRIVTPASLRKGLLNELHSIHMGVVKMKALARSYVWWPNIDKDIENVAKTCEICLKIADNPPRSTLYSWKWPEGPNYRIHADFLGPIEGKMYLLIIDAFSKWLDVKEMSDITSDTIIRAFKEYICTWGIPNKLVTDNGPSFCSETFKEFVANYNIEHIKTAPYHPASNGAAENAVKIFKKKFKALRLAGFSKHEALVKFLFYHRATPSSTTNCSPAELQIGRRFRTKLDLIKPEIRNHVERKQIAQQRNFPGKRNFEVKENEVVMTKNYRDKSWRKGRIIEKLSPVTFSVETEDKKIHKRHADQLRHCNLSLENNNHNSAGAKEASEETENHIPQNQSVAMTINDKSLSTNVESIPPILENSEKDVPVSRRSARTPKPRKIFDL